jgi:histidine triad (HIT) family protein
MKKASVESDENCIFCRIAKGTIPADIIAESDDALAFRDVNPQAPAHFLVVPRRHVASIEDATEADGLGDLLLFAARIAREEGLAEKGYRIVINTGKDGGQTVDHLHFHVVGGRAMKWPPG